MAKDNIGEFEINGQKMRLDFELWQAQTEFMKKKEDEYKEYCLSGQRTIDLFGVEGAKEVLRKQTLEDGIQDNISK